MSQLQTGPATSAPEGTPDDAEHRHAAEGSRRVSSESCPPVAGEWLVLRTASRQEKAVARFLEAQGVEHYLPLIDRVRMVRGRKEVSRVPLFPGYVFMAGEREAGYAAIKARRVCQILDVPDQHTLSHELEQVRLAIDGEAPLELHPFAVVGTRCRVTKGPFEGLEGVVVDRLKDNRLHLQVNVIGRGAVMEIDLDFLEPIE